MNLREEARECDRAFDRHGTKVVTASFKCFRDEVDSLSCLSIISDDRRTGNKISIMTCFAANDWDQSATVHQTEISLEPKQRLLWTLYELSTSGELNNDRGKNLFIFVLTLKTAIHSYRLPRSIYFRSQNRELGQTKVVFRKVCSQSLRQRGSVVEWLVAESYFRFQLSIRRLASTKGGKSLNVFPTQSIEGQDSFLLSNWSI